MAEMKSPLEQELLSVSDGEEHRKISAIWGASLAVTEVSQGPLTEVAYGTPLHGHKILCAPGACARVLGVGEDTLKQALAVYFAQDGEPLLSELMDLFDRKGERYTYAAWSGSGDGAFRPAGEVIIRAADDHPYQTCGRPISTR